MTSEQAMGAIRRSIVAGGELTITLSREAGGLFDPVKGDPVPLEASGVHGINATTLVIAPQATWSFRGTVLSGAVVTVTGHPATYATTVDASVDDTSPATISLTIPAPGLSAGLSGGEVVSIAEEASVPYSGREVEDGSRTPRGWSVTASDVLYLLDYEGKRKPGPGDIVSTPVTGSVKNVKGSPWPSSIIHCGGVSA